jgi:hypothetical protein
MIQFECPCGQRLQAKEEHVGLQVACPLCGKLLTVPGDPQAVHPAATPPSPAAPAPAPSEYAAGRPPLGPVPGPARARRARGPATALSTKALVSLILGILTFVLPVLLAIPAILLAILAIRDINGSGGRLTGKGLAVAGLVVGVVGNLSLLPYFWIFRGVRSQEARRDSELNLKQLALAMHDYNDTYRRLPAAAIYSKDGKTPLLSWRVALLPYLEQGNLYNQFKLDEPWDSPHNIRLLSQMPKVYAPVRGDAPPNCTRYQVFTGPKTPFRGPVPPRIPVTFLDGTSNTFLIVEADDAVPWTKPADLVVSPNAPLPRLGGVWGDGFLAAMADGSVRFVNTRRTSEQTLRLAIDPADGMPLPADWDDDNWRK